MHTHGHAHHHTLPPSHPPRWAWWRGVSCCTPHSTLREGRWLSLLTTSHGHAHHHTLTPSQVGMVAWCLMLHTPQYPEGREVALIANDITYQIGSFGPQEDQLFQVGRALTSHDIPHQSMTVQCCMCMHGWVHTCTNHKTGHC